MPEKTFRLDELVLNEEYRIRTLNEDAVQRYMELYQSGNAKNIKVHALTNIVLDGFHRIEAANRLKMEKIKADLEDISLNEIRSKAFEYNKSHGVPLTKEERNKLIADLYSKDGKTQLQIADLMGLTEQRIGQILTTKVSLDANNSDKRRKLSEEDYPAIVRLLIGDETQTDIASKFDITPGRVSQIWSDFRDKTFKLYSEKRLLKTEVAKQIGLESHEVELILREYEDGDPLNFEQLTSTWWPEFGLDKRFGQDHGSNLPADLVKNILALFSKPGDVILDPAAGGGIVIDVCKDMINRTCYAYDLTPQREDIKTHNLLNGPPSIPINPDLVFLDLPYGPMLKGVYSEDPNDLSNLEIPEYFEAISKIFGYWTKGILVTLMASYRNKGIVLDLPYETEKRMIENDWRIIEHIVNENGRVKSETGANVSSAREHRWLMRKHIHILVGKKDG